MAAGKTYVDEFASCLGGVNSGVSILDLPKNQAAFSWNASIRKGYFHTRPPYFRRPLNFNGDTALQEIFENGLWQGGGYYRPDTGPESLIAQIDGHLLLFTEVSGTWNVKDVSVPNDLNSASVLQVWMWQSEQWMIINDGTGVNCIFFGGTSSRRSAGDSQLIGLAASAMPDTPPPIGGPVTLTLSNPYTGPYNVPILFNGEYYMALTSGTVNPVFTANITNLNDTGATLANGTGVYITTRTLGIATNSGSRSLVSGQYIPANFEAISITFNPATTGNFHVSQLLIISGQTVKVTTVNSGQIVVTNVQQWNGPFAWAFHNGTPIYSTSNGNNVLIGNIVATAPVTVPAIGSQVSINLSAQYTGAANQVVQIGSAFYTIQNTYIPPTGGTTTLYLKNLTDTSTAKYVFTNTNIDYPTNALIMSVAELPPGKMGVYGMERNAVCLTDGLSYIMGDLVGSASGTPAYNQRDSVLKATENIDLPGAGSFRLPGAGDTITAMVYPPRLDTSLGQGALQIFTAATCFSNNASIDRTKWENPTSPLQTNSLAGSGPLGQDSAIYVNSDTFFRSYDGIGSLVLARRDFESTWGNKPISNEMQRPLNGDNVALLGFASGSSFDNRYFNTTRPTQGANGVYHRGIISLNLDLISTLRSSSPPAWESVWTGINILKMISGRVNGTLRQFAFTQNITTGKKELYEFSREDTTAYLDNNETPINWGFETPAMFGKDIKPETEPVTLKDGQIWLAEIQGSITVKAFYRPDFYPCWIPWNSFTICNSNTSKQAGYKLPINLGEPSPEQCEGFNNRPTKDGYFFQFRFEIIGKAKFMGFQPKGVSTIGSNQVQCVDDKMDCQILTCDSVDDFSIYNLQG